MKIFYGVNGVGNGHLTRARVMAKELQRIGAAVTYLFSGREQSKYFDMEIFGDCLYKEGMKFSITNGSINPVKTIVGNDFIQLFKDIKSLNLDDYDVILTDYEPITSWYCNFYDRESIGIGHQYAFDYDIPKMPGNLIARKIMKEYAPASLGVGLHWHHFDQPILPPIIETTPSEFVDDKRIVVYLPFENTQHVIHLLSDHSDYTFHIYGSDKSVRYPNHIKMFDPSRIAFQEDVSTCGGIICNAGFELASEALQLGKKILVKPVTGQIEQYANALALQRLNYGCTMQMLDAGAVHMWIKYEQAVQVIYPNVARYIAEAIADNSIHKIHSLSKVVWDAVKVIRPDL